MVPVVLAKKIVQKFPRYSKNAVNAVFLCFFLKLWSSFMAFKNVNTQQRLSPVSSRSEGIKTISCWKRPQNIPKSPTSYKSVFLRQLSADFHSLQTPCCIVEPPLTRTLEQTLFKGLLGKCCYHHGFENKLPYCKRGMPIFFKNP